MRRIVVMLARSRDSNKVGLRKLQQTAAAVCLGMEEYTLSATIFYKYMTQIGRDPTQGTFRRRGLLDVLWEDEAV